uniref:CSON010322 protein n=1 Tax=Culicoides sonorensis TaxID=179676 RepID=A0A336LHQ9_CULSO
MAAIPPELHGSKLNIGDKDVIKALGLLWHPETDTFSYHHHDEHRPVTKRAILSEVTSLFDPLGLVAPVTVLGKIFVQQLWSVKIAWDESLSQEHATSWLKLKSQLPQVKEISIPRYVLGDSIRITLHGFADASKKAYAAALYVRSCDSNGNVVVNLLCAKTKVAPLKTVTLPRLELLGGDLLAKLYKKVVPNLPFKVQKTYLWLDASIALTWIKGSPHKWTSFVATRVTNIQTITANCEWRHVPTESNPADLASRGLLPSQLKKADMWFTGPPFLQKHPLEWPNRFVSPVTVPEEAPPMHILSAKINTPDLVSNSKFQSWNSLQRVFGYVARFIANIKTKRQCKHKWSMGDALPSPLTVDEKEAGLQTAIKLVQRHHFQDIVAKLEMESPLDKRHPITSLNPFLDTTGMLRARGRLCKSVDLSTASKYPFIIPGDHPITKSLFIHTHVDLMHCGPRQLLGTVYRRFWPLNGKVLANRIVKTCLRCQWVQPKPAEQIMGMLPKFRVSIVERPFMATGVDFFEPIWISTQGRGHKRIKAYVAVFVCFTTKAIHMELVDDLSTPGFLNALQRFVSRRGCPSEMYSDNGRNFLGARNLIYDAQERYNSDEHWPAVYDWCRSHGITWNFIPPRTPHQGGLWEAAVKSAKFHLLRALGNSSLRRSEIETVLTCVEAILNSRPLVPVSLNPADEQPLTPGHFLIGGPIKSLPEPYLLEKNLNTLERYKRVMAIKQLFWKQWSHEYLHTLMNRTKWMREKPNLLQGAIVLIVDKLTKPLLWRWGKIVATHTGVDGKVRSVTVKTTTGTYDRGITEVCPLPFEDVDQVMTPSES